MSPLLVQRCKGATAGIGYLEINVICPWDILGGWLVSALLIPIGENGSILLLTLTLTTSKPSDHFTFTPTSNPQAKLLHINVLVSIPTYLWNKNQKEWHWPTNVLKKYVNEITGKAEIIFWILYLQCEC